MSTPSASQIARSRASSRGYLRVVVRHVELARVDEDGHDRRRVGGAGLPHQRAVTLVEPAHRRDEPDRARGCGEGVAKRGAGSNDLGQAGGGGSEVAIERDAADRDRAGRSVGCAASKHLVEDRVVHPDRLLGSRERPGGDVGEIRRGRVPDVGRGRGAYGRACFGMKSPRPIRSVMIWTWPLQPAPAPMPIVGMRSRSVMAAASCSGTSSRTIAEGAGLLDRERVGDQRARLVARLALDADLADRVDRLRGQPDVAHDRDPGPDERLDDPRGAHAALDLDRLGARPRA